MALQNHKDFKVEFTEDLNEKILKINLKFNSVFLTNVS